MAIMRLGDGMCLRMEKKRVRKMWSLMASLSLVLTISGFPLK